MRLFVALILILIGSLSNTADAKRLDAFEETCAIMRIDCRGMVRPIVVRSTLLDAFGLYGAHVPGEPYIFISTRAPAKTYPHEMTHYILHKLGMFQGRGGRCASEELARRVADIWAGDEYNEKWRNRYGCNGTVRAVK